MDCHIFWQLFLDTGAPEMYMLYNSLRKKENGDVSDDSGFGAANNTIQ